MEYTKIKEINEYVSEIINPMKTPDTIFEMYSVPIYDTGHPEYLRGDEIASNKVIVRKNDVLLCKINPRINRVWVVADESKYQNIASSEWIVIRNSEYNPEFLAWYFRSPKFKKLMTSEVTGIGGSLTRAQPKAVAEYPVPIMKRDDQDSIVEVLSKVDGVINARRQELQKLDELIKARFVELFGDPEINSMDLPVKPMTEVCEIIDGDRGKNYPTQEEFSDEGYCLFLNAKNVTSNGFSFENCMFVTKEKDEILRKGHLNRGDVVLTTRGTIGNLAFYDESVPYENVRINSGMVILRMNHEIVLEQFFIEQFKMQLGSIKEKIASGSAQPQLPVSTMNKIVVVMPSVEQQQVFTDFVKQVDKSKIAVQKALDEAQLLFDSLMQKYFG